jgi:hypothetical protein
LSPGLRDRQTPGASHLPAKSCLRQASTSRVLADDPREAHHHRRLIGPELLGRGLQESHQDRDQQDVVPQGWLQWSPQRVGAGFGIDLGQALQKGVGWRKALRAAIADNPFVKGVGMSPKARRELLGHGQLALAL